MTAPTRADAPARDAAPAMGIHKRCEIGLCLEGEVCPHISQPEPLLFPGALDKPDHKPRAARTISRQVIAGPEAIASQATMFAPEPPEARATLRPGWLVTHTHDDISLDGTRRTLCRRATVLRVDWSGVLVGYHSDGWLLEFPLEFAHRLRPTGEACVTCAERAGAAVPQADEDGVVVLRRCGFEQGRDKA